jgi:hypothetical protein
MIEQRPRALGSELHCEAPLARDEIEGFLVGQAGRASTA